MALSPEEGLTTTARVAAGVGEPLSVGVGVMVAVGAGVKVAVGEGVNNAFWRDFRLYGHGDLSDPD